LSVKLRDSFAKLTVSFRSTPVANELLDTLMGGVRL